jgi:hypothetical protein
MLSNTPMIAEAIRAQSRYRRTPSLNRAIATAAYSRHNAGLLIGRPADAISRRSTTFGNIKCAEGLGGQATMDCSISAALMGGKNETP